MSLRRKLISSVVFLSLLGVASGLLAQVRIATVDLHRAIMETEDGRRARRRLEGEFSNRQRELDGAQEELRRMQSELETQRNVLSRQALEQRMEAYQNRVIEVQRQFVEYQQELAQHEAELTRTIVERMQAILREVGAAEGYTVILDTSGGAVLYSPEAIDLTATLIQRYNAQAPAVTGGGAMDGDMASGDTAMAAPMMAAPMGSTMMTPAMAAP